jgi:hypothetical protein
MKERARDKPDQLYDATCAYAVCSVAAKTPVANAPGSEELANEALALLKQAVAKRFKNAAHMWQDDDLKAAICLNAMVKKSADRYGSMAESAQALGDYLKTDKQSHNGWRHPPLFLLG